MPRALSRGRPRRIALAKSGYEARPAFENRTLHQYHGRHVQGSLRADMLFPVISWRSQPGSAGSVLARSKNLVSALLGGGRAGATNGSSSDTSDMIRTSAT
jgi:hypothetical protein